MLKRSFLLIKLTLAFLLTTSLVSAVSLYQIKIADQSSDTFIKQIASGYAMQSDLESMNLKVHRIDGEVTSFRLGVASGKPVDAKAEKAAIAKLGQDIEQVKKSYQADSQASGSANRAADIAPFDDATKLVVSAQNMVDLIAASSSLVPAQAADFASTQKALDNKVSDQVAAVSELVRIERLQAQAILDGATRKNVELSALAVLVAVILGLLFAELLSRSITKIQRGAERIANGDFSRLIEVKSRDEVGLLAESFNKMAERLRDSYSRLAFERQRDETLLESMSDGLIATDGDGTVVMLNNTAVRMLSLPEQSTLVGKPVEDVLVLRQKSEDMPVAAIQERPESKAFALGRPVSDIFAYRKPDGGKLMISVGASPIVVDDKNTGAVMIIRDVTREQEVDRMKTEFISLASHQLRTPLSAIKWFTEMLVNGDAGKLTPDQADFAKNVADSTERMIDLVNSLLNISRIESGRIMVDPKPTDLSELVSGIVNDLKAKTEERQQTLVVSVHKELPKVNLDPRLISQVYLNLLTNAIKYTPKGGEISVFVSRKDDELVSQVTDNGYGIPKAEQAKMFQKFFRATNVAKIETDGTGLGLYLIKAIIESSGGKIWFESEEGKGTTFWFSLPMSGMKPKEGEVTLDQ